MRALSAAIIICALSLAPAGSADPGRKDPNPALTEAKQRLSDLSYAREPHEQAAILKRLEELLNDEGLNQLDLYFFELATSAKVDVDEYLAKGLEKRLKRFMKNVAARVKDEYPTDEYVAGLVDNMTDDLGREFIEEDDLAEAEAHAEKDNMNARALHTMDEEYGLKDSTIVKMPFPTDNDAWFDPTGKARKKAEDKKANSKRVQKAQKQKSQRKIAGSNPKVSKKSTQRRSKPTQQKKRTRRSR